MPLPSLDLDRWFPDFNFCVHTHPDLTPGHGPNRTLLAEWVYQARQGDRSARLQFADTMYRTLGEEAFRCFERTHGARPIRPSDWFYCKLIQFLELLVYERLSVTCSSGQGPETPTTDRPWEEGFLVLGAAELDLQEEDIQSAFSAEENDPALWGQIVDEICAAPADTHRNAGSDLGAPAGSKGYPEAMGMGPDPTTQQPDPRVARLFLRPVCTFAPATHLPFVQVTSRWLTENTRSDVGAMRQEAPLSASISYKII